MNLVQFVDVKGKRRVGLVVGASIIVVTKAKTTLDLARMALAEGKRLAAIASSLAGTATEDYAAALKEKRILNPVDHPDPAHCIITGTGLTHLGSASARDGMHKKLAGAADELTDSLKMFKLGLEGGKPKAKGEAGVQPEWFYKGDGSMLVPPEGDLAMPDFALDGGEEPELAGLYVVAPDGRPHRIGFALANEFSDHVLERQNYLLLAHSKLRQSAIGPELLLGEAPADLQGESRIVRDGQVAWRKPFITGEANMSHAIANLEYHHFKYALFRRPGDVHVHYFGTATLSFADGFRTEAGDIFEIEMAEFGRPLRNRLVRMPEPFAYGGVRAL